MVLLTGVSKSYGKVAALTDVDLAANEGCVTGLLGPNGAGKTTLLKTICALHYPDSGSVTVCGTDTAADPVRVKAVTGYVREQPSLYGSFTVYEFLSFIARVHGLTVKTAIEKTANICALDSVLHKKIRTLSKGFRQRVSFAQAVIHDPPVLVLDEPVSGLDPAQIHQMRLLISGLAEQGKTVLLSTHLMQEAEALCGNIYILAEGKITASGTADGICTAAGCACLEDAFLKLTSRGV